MIKSGRRPGGSPVTIGACRGKRIDVGRIDRRGVVLEVATVAIRRRILKTGLVALAALVFNTLVSTREGETRCVVVETRRPPARACRMTLLARDRKSASRMGRITTLIVGSLVARNTGR